MEKPDSRLESIEQSVQHLAEQIGNVFFTEILFDAMPDLVFFVKDLQGRYLVVNQTLVHRCGFKSKQELLGRTPLEVFPEHLASNYVVQDQLVLQGKLS